MPDDQSSPGPLRQQIGDFTPELVEITEVELKEVLVHKAPCAGWPEALSAIGVAQRGLAR